MRNHLVQSAKISLIEGAFAARIARGARPHDLKTNIDRGALEQASGGIQRPGHVSNEWRHFFSDEVLRERPGVAGIGDPRRIEAIFPT